MISQKSKFIAAIILLFAFGFTTVWAQKTTISGKIENNISTKVDLQLLYKEDGTSFGNAKVNADGTFKLTAHIAQTDLFKLVFDDGQHLMMSLSPYQNIELLLNAENLKDIKSVKGSPSIVFCKNAAEMLKFRDGLIDSLNRVLLADKDVQFFNEFQSQFKPYFEVNADANEYCVEMVSAVDSLQQFVKSKVIKGKLDSKDIDVFVYNGSNLLKDIFTNYSKFASYMQSMNLLDDFKERKNTKFEGFYSSSVDKYLETLDQRNAMMKSSFSDFVNSVEKYLQFRDSLQMNDLASKKKEKELLAAQIIELSNRISNIKELQNSFSNSIKLSDGFGKYTQQEAQRNASNIVQKYQNFFDTEYKKRHDVVINYVLANKNDLAVLMFIDLFKKDEHPELHKEVINALHESYPEQPIVVERFKKESAPAGATSVGAMAPELAFENPEGKIMKLSDLKGKVVLLDFWASWCRPCRMENPNVVKVYNKYHAKGFEIYSVSLDRDKAGWVKAIEADGLIWSYHVSDLGYWQSQAAKIYGVSSIPATFLIGKDGRIIAKNLRGAALENALKELFD
ncbi:MAG: TlpA family protein disulfide reductase [Lentimicrobiaceae bacterium]|nr:TlpA family protein disulfide reductase [Lentimicrobiaceae bacterium]